MKLLGLKQPGESRLHPTTLSKLGGDGQKPLLSDADSLVDFEAPPRSARWEGASAASAAKVGTSPGAPTPPGAPAPLGLFPWEQGIVISEAAVGSWCRISPLG